MEAYRVCTTDSEVLMACDIVQVIQARPSSSLCMPIYTDASLLAAIAQDWTHFYCKELYHSHHAWTLTDADPMQSRKEASPSDCATSVKC